MAVFFSIFQVEQLYSKAFIQLFFFQHILFHTKKLHILIYVFLYSFSFQIKMCTRMLYDKMQYFD